MSSRIRQSCLLGVVDFACTGHGERRCSQQAGPQTISWWRQGVIDLAVDSTISAPIFVSQDSRVLFVRAPRADSRGQGPEKLLEWPFEVSSPFLSLGCWDLPGNPMRAARTRRPPPSSSIPSSHLTHVRQATRTDLALSTVLNVCVSRQHCEFVSSRVRAILMAASDAFIHT